MPNTGSSAIGGFAGALAALALAGGGYYAYSHPDLFKAGPSSQFHATCEAAMSQMPPQSLKGMTVVAACDCVVSRFYPALSEPTRAYALDLYNRVEATAPSSSAERAAFDADFPARLKNASQVDQFSHMSANFQLISELQGLTSRDFQECNALIR